MEKFIHSLQFQLSAVVLAVFWGILFFLVLLFHEISSIAIKTHELAQSAEVNDCVTSWNTRISTSARERTKFMALGEESYLVSYRNALMQANELFDQIQNIGINEVLPSARALKILHEKNIVYAQILDKFSIEYHQTQSSVSIIPVAAAPKAKLKKKFLSKAMRKNKPLKISLQDKSLLLPPTPISFIDESKNTLFKNYESDLREGLTRAQAIMGSERQEKMNSLKNSIGLARDRGFYSLLLLLGLIGYLGFILKWKILDPLKVVERGAFQIAEGNLGYQIHVNSKNEIGELARDFNHMSSQLDKNQNSEVRLKRLETIDQIVRSVNHEINNPLMIISGNAEFLLAVWPHADEMTRNKLTSIINETQRIFTVTQRLKEIREPVTENYIDERDKMIDILRSSQVLKRDWNVA